MEGQAAKKIAKIGSIAGIAIAALAVVLILPDAADVFAQPEHDVETDTDRIAPTINVDDPYLELLKQGDHYLDMTPGEQEAYVQTINEMRANHDAYEREVWKLFDAISVLELKL